MLQEYNDSDSMHLVLPPEPTKLEKSPVSSQLPHPPLVARFTAQSPVQTSNLVESNTLSPVAASSTSSIPSFARPAIGTGVPSYTTTNQPANSSLLDPFAPNAHVSEVDGVEFAQHVRIIRGQIEHIERQLDQHVMPSMEHVIRIRTQLLEIQDTRHERRLPVPGIAELVGRIFDAQQRARLLDAMIQRPSQFTTPTQSSAASGLIDRGTTNSPQIFMLSSPSGDRNIIMTPNAINSPLPAMQPTFPTRTVPAGEPAAPQPNPNAAVVQNVVRQAMLNQQRRGNNVEHPGLARHMRRIWLFTRLWFFCYLTSTPGTWRRYIFVSLALLVTFLSETEIPQQFLRLVVAPAQRHLEGLTHAGGPLDPAAQAANGAPGLSIWDQVRRAERSIVLFVASLIPGLGERQVQARHAAEQERERAEQERVQREQTEERERAEQAGQSEQSEQSGQTPNGAGAVDASVGVESPSANTQAEQSPPTH
jgi:hypothetical protein